MTAHHIRLQLESNLQEQQPLYSQLQELQGQEKQLRRRLAEAEQAEKAAPSSGAGSSDDWSSDFPWDATVDSTLSARFGHRTFRPLQREVINATLSGRDCFTILPTGAGKSLLFQLPGMVAESGLTVVVSPLVALMTDQLASLKAKGVHAALLAADVTSREETTLIQQHAADPKGSGLRFLYVTPERVAKSKMLISRLQKAYLAGGLSRIAVDEAHCAAAQGHDFRPDYLSLGILRASFPSVPILALTATASDAVRADVERSLGLDPARVVRFRGHFDRANIRYTVRPKPSSEEGLLDEMAAFCRGDDAAASGRPTGRLPGIIYTLSRADAEKVQAGLSQRRVACAAYHAGCDSRTREAVQAAWHAGRLQVVVATVAFGLGIDKPDVRFVLHHTVSKSLEAYYQESGRAGRDGEQAEAVAWWKPSDYFRLVALACDSQDRHAAMAALNAAADFCEERGCCRRARFATLFRQTLAPRGTAELPHARCCDGCTALAEKAASAADAPAGRDVGVEGRPIDRSVRDVGEVAVEALRVLRSLNGAAAAAGVTDGGMAPAKLTAVKLCDKLGSKARGAAAAAAAAASAAAVAAAAAAAATVAAAVVVGFEAVVVVVPARAPVLVPRSYFLYDVLPGAARWSQAGAWRAGARRAAAGACRCRPYPLRIHRVHGAHPLARAPCLSAPLTYEPRALSPLSL